MGYRLPPPHDHPIQIDETASKTLICVDNGSIAHIAIPCFYANGEIVTRMDIMRIDHMGWPGPRRPDRSFQHHRCHEDDIEVDFEAEGYEGVNVSLLDAPSGIHAEGRIDGNIIRIDIGAFCPEAQDKDLEIPYTITVWGGRAQNDIADSLYSVVAKGILHIVAGPYTSGVM